MRVKRCLGLNMHSFTTFSFQFPFFSHYCFLDFFLVAFSHGSHCVLTHARNRLMRSAQEKWEYQQQRRQRNKTGWGGGGGGGKSKKKTNKTIIRFHFIVVHCISTKQDFVMWRFKEDVNEFSFLFLNLDTILENSLAGRFAYFWQIEWS